MKKLVSIVLTLCLILALFPVMLLSAQAVENEEKWEKALQVIRRYDPDNDSYSGNAPCME